MPTKSGPSRRFLLLLILASTALATIFVLVFRNAQEGTRDPEYIKAHLPQTHGVLHSSTLHGHAIALKLGNDTAKYVQLFGRTNRDDADQKPGRN